MSVKVNGSSEDYQEYLIPLSLLFSVVIIAFAHELPLKEKGKIQASAFRMSNVFEDSLQGNETDESVEELSGQSASAFAASVAGAVVLFAVQAGVFILVKDRLSRIYQPRTYLVPERERTAAPPAGWVKWILSVLKTTSSEFVEKCGLDAYFFLRYLRTLLKIFIPAALIILPVLIPLNAVGGRGTSFASEGQDGNGIKVTGLDRLAWGNVRPANTSRYWVHWCLALALVCYVCFVVFDEFRSYIRMRQAYLTSPQHRLRASATTVLVSSIPAKWCTTEALDGLYDVFPGGIRNIWLNRNFDDLTDKVKRRDKLALTLEAAETDLIKNCFKAHEKKLAVDNKKAGKNPSQSERTKIEAAKDEKAAQNAKGHGISSGNPHQIHHNLRDAVDGTHDSQSDSDSIHHQEGRHKPVLPIPILGEGIQAVGQGLQKISKGLIGGKGRAGQSDSADGAQHPQESDRNGANGSLSNIQSPNSWTGTDGEWEQTAHSGHSDDDRRPLGEPSPMAPIKHFGSSQESEEEDDKAVWRKYMQAKDRDTMRLPIFGWEWMISLPLIGRKVDKIYYCRKEVARLNVEIEDDQANPDRFPLMNSAFIQFNHQVAAHMACQNVSHHMPKQMAPRLVEIDPYDVIWDNMSIPWWQNYLRTAGVMAIVAGMIVLWAIPVALTSALSQISILVQTFTFLEFLLALPEWLISAIQGLLPPAFLALLLFVLPLILRLLAKYQGNQSGMLVELWVQRYYFFFLFVQIFLVVSVAAAASTILGLFEKGAEAVTSIPEILGANVPRASNYFFSYMLLQALSVSAGALVQVGQLAKWFVLAPILDSTARSKFKRQISLPEVKWGKFFPVYTNLACIGLIYSVISPLILVFNVITFSLFWFVYRYNTLYVTKFTRDTGGLLYPIALNYTFVGVYVMEIVLIGLFFLVRDDQNRAACYGQGVGMVVILILTIIYQILLNEAFGPLFRYLPITLEDDAVRRDEEFARTVRQRHGLLEDDAEDQDLPYELERYDRESHDHGQGSGPYALEQLESEKHTESQNPSAPQDFQNPEVATYLDQPSKTSRLFSRTGKVTNSAANKLVAPTAHGKRSSWVERARNRRSLGARKSYQPPVAGSQTFESFPLQNQRVGRDERRSSRLSPTHKALGVVNNLNPLMNSEKDMEAQRQARSQVADALFAGVHDELEDLTPEQRDVLVQRAFQHTAMRARRPVIWVPRDELGVSDDEVRRVGNFSRDIWISNVRQGLDAKGRCIYSGAPPDFSELDLIRL